MNGFFTGLDILLVSFIVALVFVIITMFELKQIKRKEVNIRN